MLCICPNKLLENQILLDDWPPSVVRSAQSLDLICVTEVVPRRRSPARGREAGLGSERRDPAPSGLQEGDGPVLRARSAPSVASGDYRTSSFVLRLCRRAVRFVELPDWWIVLHNCFVGPIERP